MIYVAFLRGINVGGHYVKMSAVCSVFESLGFENVRSHINSGNIFFVSDNSNKNTLSKEIEAALREALGFEVPTFLRTINELDDIINQDPFKAIKRTDDTRFCVVFTDIFLPTNVELPLQSSKNDMTIIAMNPHEAFIVWRIIHGKPPSGKFEKDLLPNRSTTRFYHTLLKIVTAAKAE